MKRIWLLGLLVQLALGACFLLDPASARVTERHDIIEPHEPTEFSIVEVAGPFEFPWSIAFLPDNSILVTERPGRLQLIIPGSVAQEVAGLPPIHSKGHGGLLDVAVDPGFAENRIVYLSYVHGTAAASTIRVLRAKLDENRTLMDPHVIFESYPATRSAEQLGGRIAIKGDSSLFLTLGDRWKPENAQDLSDHAGSIIRIHTDGSTPKDNPFVSIPEARPEIWSYGHRNPQGLAIDARTGRLWSHEHGPMGGDELNLIVAGHNYGWPVITYGLNYAAKSIGEGTAKEGMEQPVHHWTPSIAPSGLAIENAGGVTVFWIGALAGQSLVRLEMEDGRIVREQRLLENEFGRIRDVRIGRDGFLYFIIDDPEGALFRLQPAVEQASRRRSRTPL
jgi:glucose/arabinose dehydrogenase